MAKTQRPKPEHNPYRPNVWGMIDHIWTVAITKGQAPVLGVILIGFALVLKLPATDVSQLAHQILHHLESKYMLGWGLAVVQLIVTPIFFRIAGKTKLKELNRIDKLKEELETKLLEATTKPKK